MPSLRCWVRCLAKRVENSLGSVALNHVLSNSAFQEDEAFTLRISRLVESKTRIAYYAENDSSSTYRYRAANMAGVLNEYANAASSTQLKPPAACLFSEDIPEHAQQIAECADILVISRARYDQNMAQLVHLFKPT